MTIKDDLHTLVNELDEADAREALEFLKARAELDPHVSRAYIDDGKAALVEADAADAVLLPHAAVRTWLETWGTSGEAAGDRAIEALEERLTDEARARATRGTSVGWYARGVSFEPGASSSRRIGPRLLRG